MTKLIYITRRIPDNGIQLLKDRGYDIDVGEKEEAPTKEDLRSALSKKPYDAVISFLTDKIDKDIFDVCPTVNIFAQYCVGFDNVDMAEAKNRNIIVTNTPGCAARAVAEHAVALILTLTTRTMEGDLYMREGKYKGWSPNLLTGTDLSNKTIGIVGSGAIGFQVASILHHGFNCPIIYTDINSNSLLEESCGAIFVDKETLFKTSDIVSLHVPLLPSTHHLVNKEIFSQMKPTSFIINTARGPVIDEVALVDALKRDVIRGAGLDVYEFEPSLTEELNALPDIVLTPHIASARESVRNKMAEIAAQNIISFFETGKALNEVK